MKKMKNLLTMILLSLTMCVTSCDNSVGVPDKPAEPEVTLEDALNDGTVVAFTFNLNDEEFYGRRIVNFRWYTTKITTRSNSQLRRKRLPVSC